MEVRRDEVNGRVIMTHQQDDGLFQINVDEITDGGLFWLSKFENLTKERAERIHANLVNACKPSEIHYCSCGEIATIKYRLNGKGYCRQCWDLGPGQNGG